MAPLRTNRSRSCSLRSDHNRDRRCTANRSSADRVARCGRTTDLARDDSALHVEPEPSADTEKNVRACAGQPAFAPSGSWLMAHPSEQPSPNRSQGAMRKSAKPRAQISSLVSCETPVCSPRNRQPWRFDNCQMTHATPLCSAERSSHLTCVLSRRRRCGAYGLRSTPDAH
jgi:hypothetical protein